MAVSLKVNKARFSGSHILRRRAQPRKSVYRVYSSRALCISKVVHGGRMDASITCFKYGPPPTLPPPAILPDTHTHARACFLVPPPGGRTIDRESIHQTLAPVTSSRGMRYFTLRAGPELTCPTTKWTVTLTLLLFLLHVCFVLT